MITGKILGKKYVINGISVDASGSIPDMSADIYYEVVRLIDGKLLFLHDHLARLQQSITGSGIAYPGNKRIIENLGLLIKENSSKQGNLRISLQQASGSEPLLQCYFIPYFYPQPEMYKEGVKLAIYPHKRTNPGIKKWDDQFRNSVSSYILAQKVYEAALLNPQNQITEGSRSNIFYIDRNGSLITVPAKSVLPGITRKYVLEIAADEGILIEERTISTDALDSLVSVFISGTSPKVLPVKQIDDFVFDVGHPLLRRLMEKFDQLLDQNLSRI
jgi:branched-chain amino acid aminotransferase